MHPLIQRAIIRRMTPEEQKWTLSYVVALLSVNFPDTFTEDVGHQIMSWPYSERSLPHIESILSQIKRFKTIVCDDQGLADLLLRVSWYG